MKKAIIYHTAPLDCRHCHAIATGKRCPRCEQEGHTLTVGDCPVCKRREKEQGERNRKKGATDGTPRP